MHRASCSTYSAKTHGPLSPASSTRRVGQGVPPVPTYCGTCRFSAHPTPQQALRSTRVICDASTGDSNVGTSAAAAAHRASGAGVLPPSNHHQQDSNNASISSDSSSSEFAAYQQHDILCYTSSEGGPVFLEVSAQAAAGSALSCSWRGVTYKVTADSNNCLVAKPTGWQLTPAHPLVTTLPGWAQQLSQQRVKAALPTQALHLQAPVLVGSPARLQQHVSADPRLWRDGTGPSDPPLQGIDQQLLCAGELECLLQRQRGVAMVQLSVGWDTGGAPQPVENPLVTYQLQRVLARPDLSIFMSKAPGGLGLTAIIAAKAEPFRSWAAHLASFGAQAALVADSPYYKLLIGTVLGYKEENILHHIRLVHGFGVPSPQVRAAVARELRQLSKQSPQLPWTAPPASSGKGRQAKQAAARSAGKKRR